MATPKKPKFVVGIDLGTTNSAAAFSPVDRTAIRVFEVPQLIAAGETASLPLLPSALYLPGEGELPEGAAKLPWGGDPNVIVGELAKRQGARVPGRIVSSAKSWLCHESVDRTAAILPWGAPEGVAKVSPVDASSRFLAHVGQAWDRAHPEARLAEQEVILTVPASFDEAARELTVRAAKLAGLERLRLLEEPQAAFYDFLRQHEAGLGEALAGVRLVLVIDVGGGTTDLTLVRVGGRALADGAPPGPPSLERIAVGEHLMLGGDNMDVTLAHHAERRLYGGPGQLDATQWSALVHACRLAKEALLGPAAPARHAITLVGRGSKLFSSAQTVPFERAEVEALLLDGFFPRTLPNDLPARERRAALTELGLPYASDAAISRHICSFLRRHAEAAASSDVPIVKGLPRPDAVLLNGGIFNGPGIVARLGEVLAGWFDSPIPLLPHDSLDLAVARGAAYYGLVRRGFGVRIAGGAARSYYVGVETSGGQRQALCLVPRGMEEGTELEIKDRTFRLALGRPITFPLYSSTSDRVQSVSALIAVDDDLLALPPLATVLRAQDGESAEVPVRLRSSLTELGTLEVYLTTVEGFRRRWRLEFSIRDEASAGGGTKVAPIDELPKRFDEARQLVDRCYGKSPLPAEAREIKNLMRQLEKTIGERDSWSWAVSRELGGVVLRGAQKRRRSADHERVFFQLVSFCLRPGFGAPLDDFRVGELFKIFDQGVQYQNEKANWSEWWILWRRVAGGLDRVRQQKLLDAVRPSLRPREGGWALAKKPKAEGHEEMVRMVASLERVTAEQKVEVGHWLWSRLDDPATASLYWPIGRLGARQPMYGSAHDILPRDVAAGYLERLFALDWRRADGASFAAVQLARVTGDRERDLPEALREKVFERLQAQGAPESWLRTVREVAPLDSGDEMRVFGDTLPVGLRI